VSDMEGYVVDPAGSCRAVGESQPCWPPKGKTPEISQAKGTVARSDVSGKSGATPRRRCKCRMRHESLRLPTEGRWSRSQLAVGRMLTREVLMTEELRQLPLAEVHREAGARFGAFAGWSMPLTYPAGVMQEHQHTRAHAGLFDISHMKLVEISGADAQRLLAHASPLEPDALRQGQGKYSFLLNDEAGILDDIIVTRLGPDRYMVVVDAGNADADIAHYRRLAAGLDVEVDPLERVFLALQGPDAAGVLAKAGLDGSGLGFMTASEPRPGWFLSR